MKNLVKLLTLTIFLSLLATSCSEDNDDNLTNNPRAYENGILISGEGSSLSGSISYVSEDLSRVENNIYTNTNSEELGNYLQSIGFNGDKAYIVIDASIITVVNSYTFEKLGTITTGLQIPRFIGFEDGKGYVSNWGDPLDPNDDFIAVVNLSTNTIEATIPVGEGPEQVLARDGKVFVSHKGGWGSNNIVSVIDTSNNSVSTIQVGDVPDEMVINETGDLVVLSEGATLYDANWNVIGSTPAAITKVDRATNTVISELTFADGVHPSLMTYKDGTLYYMVNNDVYTMNDTATSLPATPVLTVSASYVYGFGVNDNKLYVCDASFTGLSSLLVYDLATSSEIASFEVGQAASKVYFN